MKKIHKKSWKMKEKCHDGWEKFCHAFKRKPKESKEEVIEIDDSLREQKIELKFKKKHGPRLIVTSKKGKFVSAMLVALPLLVAGAGATLGIMAATKDGNKKVVEVVTDKATHRVYLIDRDNYIVPVTVQTEKRLNVAEEYLDIFNLMKVDTSIKSDYLRGFIPSETTIKSIDLEGSTLVVNLSESFLNYEEKYDFKMIQAMTYSFLEMDGVQSVSYLVESKPLEKLKNSKVTIPNEIDRSIGINRQSGTLDDALSKEDLIVYYSKSYDKNNTLMVPVSVYADKGATRLESIYNAMSIKPATLSGLKSITEYGSINREVKPFIKDDVVNITVKDDAKLDEMTIKRSVYEVIKLTLDQCEVDNAVSLLIDGDTVLVDGYYADDVQSVSSIIYNSVAV